MGQRRWLQQEEQAARPADLRRRWFSESADWLWWWLRGGCFGLRLLPIRTPCSPNFSRGFNRKNIMSTNLLIRALAMLAASAFLPLFAQDEVALKQRIQARSQAVLDLLTSAAVMRSEERRV